MPQPATLLRLSIALLICLMSGAPTNAANPPYRTGFTHWQAADDGFRGWERSGTTLGPRGMLLLEPTRATQGRDPYPAGGYKGRNFYNGGTFLVGEATSPVTQADFGFIEAVASWNAMTLPGSWVETQLRVRRGTRWTAWYNMGVWAADSATVQRHSVDAQRDGDGRVAVDTLVLNTSQPAATAFQLKVRLFSTTGSTVPHIVNTALTYSTQPTRPDTLVAGNRTLWNRTLDLPECSQMVYPDGGEVWCSPTSMSMVLGYWAKRSGPCERRVRAAKDGVFDWMYEGHGNWSFNAAYATTQGMDAYIARFASLKEAEPWIAAGVPVIISFGWTAGSLTGAPASSSSGHISVIAGFDASGNPVVHDPAAADNGSVQRTYRRAEFERLWLEHSGGTVYLVYPHLLPVPDL